jgi:PEP-CTERM motif
VQVTGPKTVAKTETPDLCRGPLTSGTSIAGWKKLIRHSNLLVWRGDSCVWGLTAFGLEEFWACHPSLADWLTLYGQREGHLQAFGLYGIDNKVTRLATGSVLYSPTPSQILVRRTNVRLKHLCLALPLAAVCSLTAHADVFGTFELSSQFQSGASATGTITIDETLGSATTADFTYIFGGKSTVYDTIISQQANDGVEFTQIGTLTNYFGLTTPGTWVGYTGGSLCTAKDNCPVSGFPGAFYVTAVIGQGPKGGFDIASSGSLTAEPNTGVTPEPSSIALLGTGLLGTLGMIRRRMTA